MKRGKGLAGFANAVLRKVAAHRPEVRQPPSSLAVPDWLRRSLHSSIGSEHAEALLHIDEEAPSIDLRVRADRNRDVVADAIVADTPGRATACSMPAQAAEERPRSSSKRWANRVAWWLPTFTNTVSSRSPPSSRDFGSGRPSYRPPRWIGPSEGLGSRASSIACSSTPPARGSARRAVGLKFYCEPGQEIPPEWARRSGVSSKRSPPWFDGAAPSSTRSARR